MRTNALNASEVRLSERGYYERKKNKGRSKKASARTHGKKEDRYGRQFEDTFSVTLDVDDLNPFMLETVSDVVALAEKYVGDRDE